MLDIVRDKAEAEQLPIDCVPANLVEPLKQLMIATGRVEGRVPQGLVFRRADGSLLPACPVRAPINITPISFSA